MKCLVWLCLMMITLAGVMSVYQPRECVYDPWGMCMHECPPGTVSFGSPCGAPPGTTYTSRTCKEPLRRDVSGVCDMSWCGCANEDLYWDSAQGACVKLEDCSETILPETGDENEV